MLVKINKILSVFLVLCLYNSVTFSKIANEIEKIYLKFDTTQIIPPLLLGITYQEGMYGIFEKEKQIKFGRINKEPDIVDINKLEKCNKIIKKNLYLNSVTIRN